MQSSLILEQTQKLSGAQLQSLKLLACTNQELDALMQTEYLENPLLEASTDRQGEAMENLEKFYETGGASCQESYDSERDDPGAHDSGAAARRSV